MRSSTGEGRSGPHWASGCRHSGECPGLQCVSGLCAGTRPHALASTHVLSHCQCHPGYHRQSCQAGGEGWRRSPYAPTLLSTSGGHPGIWSRHWGGVCGVGQRDRRLWEEHAGPRSRSQLPGARSPADPHQEPAQRVFCSRTRVGSWNREPSRPLMTGTVLQRGAGEEQAAALGVGGQRGLGAPHGVRHLHLILLWVRPACRPSWRSHRGSESQHRAGLDHFLLVCGTSTEQDLPSEVRGKTAERATW